LSINVETNLLSLVSPWLDKFYQITTKSATGILHQLLHHLNTTDIYTCTAAIHSVLLPCILYYKKASKLLWHSSSRFDLRNMYQFLTNPTAQNSEPFGCADKPLLADLLWEKKYCSGWKKNKLKKTDYKPNEQGLRCSSLRWRGVSWVVTNRTLSFSVNQNWSSQNTTVHRLTESPCVRH
jgi:hypothetical protein